jgi:DNA anti-recombination protein RmuC
MPEPDVSVMFSTVIRMIGNIERALILPREDVRVIGGQLHALEEQVAQLTERIDNHVAYSEKAIGKAEESMTKRLDSMNEIREQLKDQAETFLPIVTYEANHRLLEMKVESLQKFMYIITGALLVIQVMIGFIEKMAMP